MYVPPINGSEILVWNAEMPTNWMVLRGMASVSRRLYGIEQVTWQNFGERYGQLGMRGTRP